jgi:hypothetical protein
VGCWAAAFLPASRCVCTPACLQLLGASAPLHHAVDVHCGSLYHRPPQQRLRQQSVSDASSSCRKRRARRRVSASVLQLTVQLQRLLSWSAANAKPLSVRLQMRRSAAAVAKRWSSCAVQRKS